MACLEDIARKRPLPSLCERGQHDKVSAMVDTDLSHGATDAMLLLGYGQHEGPHEVRMSHPVKQGGR